MIVDRYYYQQLSKAEQVVYNAIYRGVMAHQELIPLPIKGSLPNETLTKIYSALTNDNPLIYYLNQSMYGYGSDRFGNVALCPQYFWKKEKVREYNRKIERAISDIVYQLNLMQETAYEKEKKIHDWMCWNVSYDYDGTDLNDPMRVILSHNIIGVFAHHRARCEGIAKAVKVLLNTVDIKCIVVVGDTTDKGQKIPHAWNIVKLDQVPYHLDVTWDIGHSDPKNRSGISYDYFNITDAMIGKTHHPEGVLPKCDSLTDNCFIGTGRYSNRKERRNDYGNV